MAQERIRGLEEQVELLHEQLEAERNRNAALVEELKTATVQDKRGPWCRFRQIKGVRDVREWKW